MATTKRTPVPRAVTGQAASRTQASTAVTEGEPRRNARAQTTRQVSGGGPSPRVLRGSDISLTAE